MTEKLPPFPVDEYTLAGLEHALGAKLIFEKPEGSDREIGPWVAGADYTMHMFLQFMSNSMGRDPNERLLYEMDGVDIFEDTRPCYSTRDVIEALIGEVRRLRATASE